MNCEGYGATVVLHGDHILEAAAHAGEVYEKGAGMTYINGYDHPDV
jgi:threonine dehydratase